MKDAFGKKVEVGDDVVYSVKNSTSVTLNRGVVSDIVESTDKWTNERTQKLKVQIFESSDTWQKLPRTATVTQGRNLVVI